MQLKDRIIVITGAASGIGRATVDLFVAEGARVIAADIQDDKGARIEEDNKGRARYVRCDVSVESDIANADFGCEIVVRRSGRLVAYAPDWSRLPSNHL